MLETFRARQHGHTFDDPFSTAFQQMVNRLMSLTDQHGVLRAHKAFTPLYTKLHDLRQTSWTIVSEHRFEAWLDHLDRLVLVIDGTLELLRDALKRARNEFKIDELKMLIDYCENGSKELQEFKQGVSKTHVTLQLHFVFTTMRGVRNNQLENIRRADFFSGLYELRDSYFYEPRPETLETYVHEYERLIQEPYYFEQVVIRPEDEQPEDDVTAELAEATAKLDVASLVELAV